MIVKPRSRRPLTVALVIAALLLLYVYRSQLEPRHASPVKFKAPKPSSTRHPEPVQSELANFWRNLLDAFVEAKPSASPIKAEHPEDEEMDPKKLIEGHPPREKKEHVTNLSESDRQNLKKSHAQFVAAAKILGPQLPYAKHSKGIVMTAGGKYIGNAVLSLLMLRRTGSNLPVQLFLDSSEDFNNDLCESTLLELNVECRSMEDVWKTTPSMPRLKKFQFKIFAILFSTFDHTLFLDADAFPIHNVDHLFDVDPYKSTGLVTWPDLWLSTSSPSFYDIADIKAPAIEERRTSESGIMLISRSKHADSMIMAAYYNFYGPDIYYPLLSQTAHGEGDKETFLHGAMVMGRPFYDVQTPISFLGRWLNGTFETSGMKQADPMEDFDLRGRPKAKKGAMEREGDLKARTLFIHHNLVKLDMNKLGESMAPALRRDEHGNYLRLWGDDTTLIERSGYDVEKAMWEEIIRIDCHQSFLADCTVLRQYYQAVFGTEEKRD